MTQDQDTPAARQARLQMQFRQAPECLLAGVISASGCGAGRTPADPLWNLSLTLIAWRVDGAPLRQEPLRISARVDEQRWRELSPRLRAQTLVGLRVRLVEDSPFGDVRARLLDVVEAPQDEELEQALARDLAPVKLELDDFGTLTLDKSIDAFDGTARWLGQDVRISFPACSDQCDPQALSTARALWQAQADWQGRLELAMLEELLPLKNDVWREEGERALGAADFLGAVRLQGISFEEEGAFVFWIEDGDLFWGHVIMANASLAGGIEDVAIAG